MSGYYAKNPHYAPDDFSEDRERLERCEAEASRWFNRATTAQLAAHRATCAAAACDHGHGSAAHLAAINLSNRQWAHDTREARELCEATLQELMQAGEVSQELSYRWDLLDVAQAMSEAAE